MIVKCENLLSLIIVVFLRVFFKQDKILSIVPVQEKLYQNFVKIIKFLTL